MSYNKYKFYPAWEDEKIVYGASRPGYNERITPVKEETVNQWIDFIIGADINSICILLSDYELKNYYDFDLLSKYENIFGKSNILYAPVNDFTLINYDLLHSSVIPFLKYMTWTTVIQLSNKK